MVKMFTKWLNVDTMKESHRQAISHFLSVSQFVWIVRWILKCSPLILKPVQFRDSRTQNWMFKFKLECLVKRLVDSWFSDYRIICLSWIRNSFWLANHRREKSDWIRTQHENVGFCSRGKIYQIQLYYWILHRYLQLFKAWFYIVRIPLTLWSSFYLGRLSIL